MLNKRGSISIAMLSKQLPCSVREVVYQLPSIEQLETKYTPCLCSTKIIVLPVAEIGDVG